MRLTGQSLRYSGQNWRTFWGYIEDVKPMEETVQLNPEDQQTHRFCGETSDNNFNQTIVVSFGDRPTATIAMLALRKQPNW